MLKKNIIIISLIYCNPSFSDGHKTKFKDIKGFKKQFISMSEKKIKRIKTARPQGASARAAPRKHHNTHTTFPPTQTTTTIYKHSSHNTKTLTE